MPNIIIGIDAGNTLSGYVVLEHDWGKITRVLEKGKVENNDIFQVLDRYEKYDLAIEMIASQGMAVGRTVFETCVWNGRFYQHAADRGHINNFAWIYRKDEKMNLCGSMKAKDKNIIQALIDRFAPYTPNMGKGTKKDPGFFYGFKADVWQAMAVATVYFDLYIKYSRQV